MLSDMIGDRRQATAGGGRGGKEYSIFSNSSARPLLACACDVAYGRLLLRRLLHSIAADIYYHDSMLRSEVSDDVGQMVWVGKEES